MSNTSSSTEVELKHTLTWIRYWIKWLASGMSVGGWASPYLGRGFDYQGTRPFRDDPDLVRLNLRASIIEGELVVNTFAEERDIRVYVLADLSPTMVFGSQRSKAERLALLTAILAFSAARAKDWFEFIGCIANAQPRFPKFSGERKYPLRLAKAILSFDNANAERGGFLEAAVRLGTRPRSLVILISDFLGDPDELSKVLSLIAFRHDLIPIVLWDQRELELPSPSEWLPRPLRRLPWPVPFRDLETGKLSCVLLTPGTREAHRRNVERQRTAIQTMFHRFGTEPYFVTEITESDLEALIKLFLRRRSRL